MKKNILKVLAVTVALGGFTFYFEDNSDILTVSLNFGFLFVMALMVLFAVAKGVNRLDHFSQSLSVMSFQFQKDTEGKKESERRVLALKAIKNASAGDPYLQSASLSLEKAFVKAVKEKRTVDIRHYISKEQLLVTANNGYCELLPGILTAMGILGTFLGLILGLQSFGVSDAEQMTGTISILVSGIKVAFFTSIYGVLYSVLFNLIHNSSMNRFEDSYENMVERFQEKVMADPQKVFMKEMMDQGSAYVDKIDTLGEHLAKNLESVLLPSFENVNESIRTLLGRITSQQNDALENLVNQFVTALHSELGTNFEDLGQIVGQLAVSQKATVAGTEELLKKLEETENATLSMQEGSQRLMYIFESYIGRITLSQDKLQELVEQMGSYIQTMSENQDKENDKQSAYEKQLEQLGTILYENKCMQIQLMDLIKNSFESMKESTEELKNVITESKKEYSEEQISKSDMRELIEKIDVLARTLAEKKETSAPIDSRNFAGGSDRVDHELQYQQIALLNQLVQLNQEQIRMSQSKGKRFWNRIFTKKVTE
ncbi:MAG: hypothetical protein EOM40_04955 [Clostridia bacterium]|nr:hypothetical protein [Clostridia bacterium]